MVMDGSDITNGAPLGQQPYNGGNSQQWDITWQGTGMDEDSPMKQTITRVSPTHLISDTVRLKPARFANNTNRFDCQLDK